MRSDLVYPLELYTRGMQDTPTPHILPCLRYSVSQSNGPSYSPSLSKLSLSRKCLRLSLELIPRPRLQALFDLRLMRRPFRFGSVGYHGTTADAGGWTTTPRVAQTYITIICRALELNDL